jgi:hypothetical protein
MADGDSESHVAGVSPLGTPTRLPRWGPRPDPAPRAGNASSRCAVFRPSLDGWRDGSPTQNPSVRPRRGPAGALRREDRPNRSSRSASRLRSGALSLVEGQRRPPPASNGSSGDTPAPWSRDPESPADRRARFGVVRRVTERPWPGGEGGRRASGSHQRAVGERITARRGGVPNAAAALGCHGVRQVAVPSPQGAAARAGPASSSPTPNRPNCR